MKQLRKVNIERLKFAAWDKGVKETAEAAGVSVATVDKLINNRAVHFPTDKTQRCLSKALDIPLDELFPPTKVKKENKRKL